MNGSLPLVAAAILCAILHTGCSVTRTFCSNSVEPKTASVELTPWLGATSRIAIASSSTNLADLLLSQQASQKRSGTRLVAAALKEQERAEHIAFDDNCVVLQRGNNYWYFFEPIEWLELYAGSILLRDGDKLYCLPFQQCQFVTENPESGVQYFVRDLDGETQRKQTPATESLSISAALFQEPPLSGWTTTIITRVLPNGIHRLLIPGPISSGAGLPPEVLDRLTYTKLLAGTARTRATLQSGDLIERLNVLQIANRL